MLGNKLERRTFLKYCAATAVGTSLITSPLDLLAHAADKRKKEKFHLSKPRWIIYDNGSYDLISSEIILKNCRPAINGQGVMPKNVFLGDSPKGKRIVYELPGGFLMLDLKTNKNSISIGAEFSGFSQAPRWFFPISQAEVFGVNEFFQQGYGTNGPSGIISFDKKSPQTHAQSFDSFLTFGFLGKKETIAVGNVDHNDFYQRFTLYNRPHYGGLNREDCTENQLFFESGMLLDETPIQNEYIKLPELHFYTGNIPIQTFRELAWETGQSSKARQNSPTSFHWLTPTYSDKENCFEHLKSEMDFAKANKVQLHSYCIRNYCVEGDWLNPNKNWSGGLDNAARQIFKDGVRAGISIAPFRVSDKSKVFRSHKDWIIKDIYNEMIPEETVGDETFYALDASHPGVQRYIQKVFRSLRKMGFIFYETPHLEYGLKDSSKVSRKENGKSNVQILRDACQIIRDEIGPGSLWLTDHVPYGPMIGFADIVQITGNDTESANISFERCIDESWYSHYFNNIYWQNSPRLISENTNKNWSETEQISLKRWATMLGGAVASSNKMTDWNQEQIEDFSLLEPDKRPTNAYLPFWPKKDAIRVVVRPYREFKGWGILFLNNSEEIASETYELFDLIETETAHIFRWEKESEDLGKKGKLAVTLRPHESKLYFISMKKEAPPAKLTLGGIIAGEQTITIERKGLHLLP